MEQRESPRVATELRVEIEHGEFVGITEDLSRGGMFVRTQRTFPRGSRLHLEIELPGGPTEVDVEICWLRSARNKEESGLGVKFITLSDEMSAYLDNAEIPLGKAPVAREG